MRFCPARRCGFQDRALDQARLPAGAEAEAEGDERRLAVGGVQGVDLVLQRLEGVVTLFLGARHGIAFGVRDLPLFRHLQVFAEALVDERRQDFIDAVDGGAAINMAGDLGDDLRGHGGGGGDRLRRLDFGVAHLEAVGQHAFQIDQHAVEHREERRVVEIVVVNFAAFMGQHHVARQDVLFSVVFGDDARQQVALGGDHLAVLVGVLVQQRAVALLDQAANFLVQAAAQLARHVAIVAVFDIGARQLFVLAGHQLVFHRLLDLVDIDARLLLHALSDHAGDGGAVVGVDHAHRQRGALDGLRDARFVKGTWQPSRLITTGFTLYSLFPEGAFIPAWRGEQPSNFAYPQGKAAARKGCGGVWMILWITTIYRC